MEEKKSMKLTSTYLPESYIEGLKQLVKEKRHLTQSAAMRTAIEDLLKGVEPEIAKGILKEKESLPNDYYYR